MKRFLTSVIAAASFASSAIAAGDPSCFNSYSQGNCVGCTTGRAYLLVDDYCTVCLRFCNFGALVATGQTVAFTDIPGERLLIAGEPSTFYSLASVNPEAAMLLLRLFKITAMVNAPTPTQGDGASQMLYLPAAVVEASNPSATSESVLRLTTPMPDPSLHSRGTWELSRLKSSTILILRHRIADKTDREVRTLYPDIDVQLTWQPSGDAGYWRAIGWKLH